MMNDHEIVDGWARLRWHQNSGDRHQVTGGHSESPLIARGKILEKVLFFPHFRPTRVPLIQSRKRGFSVLWGRKYLFSLLFLKTRQSTRKAHFSRDSGKKGFFGVWKGKIGFLDIGGEKRGFRPKTPSFWGLEKSSQKPPNSAHPRGIRTLFLGVFALFLERVKKGVFPVDCDPEPRKSGFFHLFRFSGDSGRKHPFRR